MQKTHYLEFKTGYGENVRLECTKKQWQDKLEFWRKNESYPEKLNQIILDSKNERTFTMADFTGRSGKIKRQVSTWRPSLPEPPQTPEESEKKRVAREAMEDKMAAGGSEVFIRIVAKRKND